MSTSSREKASSRVNASRRRKRTHEKEIEEPPAPQWMVDADQRSLNDCLLSLMDAFNDIESVAKPIMDIEGVDLFEYDPGFDTFRRLSSDCITLYNECDALINDHAGELNEKRLQYLRHLRNLCAHRFGTSMPTRGFLDAVVNVILPMKESIRSMLFDVIKGNPGTGMEDRVTSFSPRRGGDGPAAATDHGANSQGKQRPIGTKTFSSKKKPASEPRSARKSRSGQKPKSKTSKSRKSSR